jgi:hypothetical protein
MLISLFVRKITAIYILHELNKRNKQSYTERSHIRKNVLSCLIKFNALNPVNFDVVV